MELLLLKVWLVAGLCYFVLSTVILATKAVMGENSKFKMFTIVIGAIFLPLVLVVAFCGGLFWLIYNELNGIQKA